MRITQQSAARRARAALVTALAAGAGMSGLLGLSGVAHASTTARPDGYVVTTSCTGVSGQISYSPGMRTAKTKSVNATLTGTTSGCSNINEGAFNGTGTLTAVLSGTASVDAENFSGTFTINWPSSSGFSPSDGNLSVTDSNGRETIEGTVTSGFETGAELGLQYVTTGNTGTGKKGHPVTAQTYVNTQSLTLSEDFG